MNGHRDEPIRVLVVDDHPVTRDGVRAALARAGCPAAVAEADGVTAARRLLPLHRPDVVLVDLRLAEGSGLDLVRHLAVHEPQTRVLVFSQAAPDDVLAAVRAGAHGFVGKAATATELAHGIRAVLDGPVLPPELAARIIAEFQHSAGGGPRLTPREREVLRCLAKGHDNREIADELQIAVRTVNRHLEAIRAKLNLRRRSELIRYAREHPEVG